jgi:integrase
VESRRAHHRRLFPRFANHLLDGSWLDVAQTIYNEQPRSTASLICNTLVWELHHAEKIGMRTPGDHGVGVLSKVFSNPRTRWLNAEQCAAVDDALDELAETRRYGSGVDALRCCMLLPIRSGAIFRLQWSQIGGDFESLTVVDKGKPRTWAVGSVVRELLARRRRDARAACWVFWGRPVTQHIHPTTVRTIFLKALAIAKIDPVGVSVHTLRHSLGTNLILDGEAIETAQRALGHSSPKITEQYYLHHVPTRARVAVESLNLKVISLKARKAQ